MNIFFQLIMNIDLILLKKLLYNLLINLHIILCDW